MRKDVKIGMVIGSLMVLSAIVWLSTHSNLNNIEPSPGSQTQREEKPHDARKYQSVSVTDAPDTQIAANKPHEILTFNKEIAKLTEPASTQHKEPQQTQRNRIHTVEQGETLSGISQTYYGTASGWQKIYVANRKLLSSPDKIRPGMRLTIPD